MLFVVASAMFGCVNISFKPATFSATNKSANYHSDCRTIERNLTVHWSERTYWCRPKK